MAKKPEFWEYPLGADADVNTLGTNPDNTKGDATLRGLFPVLTSTRLKDGGIPPQRKDINALFKLIGENIYFLQHGGQYEWSTDITYDQDAIVMKNGTLFKAKQQTQGNDPLTNPGIWDKVVEVQQEDLDLLRSELPKDASTESKGVVMLSNDIGPDSTTAITPYAVSEFKDQFETLKSDYENFKETVDIISDGATGQLERLQALEDGLATNDTNDVEQTRLINEIKEDLADANRRIDGLASFDVSDITNDIQGLRTDIQNESTTNQNQDTRLESLETRAQNHENDLSDLQTESANVQNSITVLEQSRTSLEHDIESIEDEIDSIAGVFTFNPKDEYEVGNIVCYDEELFVCRNQITKPGQPTEVQQGEEGYEEYLRQKEAWDNAETGISISDKTYWLPLNHGTGYDKDITYSRGDIVVRDHKLFECLQESTGITPQDGTVWKELTQQPSLGIFAWDESTTFKAGQVVLVDKVLYKCVKTNIGNNPSLDSANNNANWVALNTGSGNTGSSADLDSLSAIIAGLPTAGIFNYSADKTYSKNQIVRYGTSLWLAQDSTSEVPTDESNWVRLSKVQIDDVRPLMADLITYNSKVQYKVNDVVQYGDYLWRAKASVIGVNPVEGTSWTRLGQANAEDQVIKSLKSRLDENDSLDNQQQTRLSNLENTTAGLQTAIDGLDLTNVSQQIQDTSELVDGLKTRVNNLETDSGTKKTQIEALQSDVNDLKLHDTAVQTTLDGIQSDVDNLKNAGIDDIKSDISGLKAEDVSIKSRLKTLEDTTTGGVDLSAIQQDVENLQSDISNLQKIDHSQYALKSEIPEAQDLSAYAKTSDVEATYAKKSDIPEGQDLSEYAKKSDLNNYAKTSDIPEIPDLTEYAKKSDIPEVPEIDTSTLATKSSVDTLSTQVQQNTTDIANLKKNSGSSGSSGGSGQNIGIYSLVNPEEDTDQYFITITYKGEEGACTGVKATTTRSLPVEIYLDSSKRLDSLSIHVIGNITSMLQDNGKLIKSFMLKYNDGRTQTSYEEWDSKGENLLTQAQGLRAFPAIYFQHSFPAATQYSDWATDQGKVYFWSRGDEIIMRADASATDTKKSQFGNYTDVNFIIKLNF